MSDETPATPEAPTKEAHAADAKPSTVEPSDLEKSRRQNEELLTKLKYAQAEYENYRKQVAREMEMVLKFAHEALLVRLLPVLDDFDAALANLDGETAQGVRMVHDHLVKALGEGGLQEIRAEGERFDPYVHDCVQRVPDSGLVDGMVKQVVRKGYRLQERVLRPAQVIVVKNEGESNG
jgi:molecular chaperone GrpE